jgi:hypothetical protein
MCLKPIPWPLTGPYGDCTGPGDHRQPVNHGPSALDIWPNTPADCWTCLNCKALWLKDRTQPEAT